MDVPFMCYIGRWNKIYRAPRELIEKVNSGRSLIEMEKNRSKDMCCGAGGGRMFMEENIGERINNVRAKEMLQQAQKL